MDIRLHLHGFTMWCLIKSTYSSNRKKIMLVLGHFKMYIYILRLNKPRQLLGSRIHAAEVSSRISSHVHMGWNEGKDVFSRGGGKQHHHLFRFNRLLPNACQELEVSTCFQDKHVSSRLAAESSWIAQPWWKPEKRCEEPPRAAVFQTAMIIAIYSISELLFASVSPQ